ncbi:hypothetical protein [Mucilaginibacter sp. 3215]|uniref:hypothetical protein n=1 Tax=Mucilaginibacter sp. 3215 TaxID=3373912 RepID=UPI003D254550
MLKPNKIVDISFLILFGISALITIYQGISNTFLLTINNYLAFLLYAIMVGLKFYSPIKGKYGVLILLGLSLVDIINFSAVVINAKIYHLDSGWSVNGLGFNIIAFILLIVYYFFNTDFVLYILRSLFVGSDKELADKKEKLVNFYYNKFREENNENFDSIFKNIETYPDEAQVALKKIKIEREV